MFRIPFYFLTTYLLSYYCWFKSQEYSLSRRHSTPFHAVISPVHITLFWTNNTRQFSSVNIRRARQWSTHSFDRVKQGSVFIGITPSQPFRCFVHAHELFGRELVHICYQTSLVFHRPTFRTCSFRWNHDLCGSVWNEAHGTERIDVVQSLSTVVMQWKYWRKSMFLFWTIKFRMPIIQSIHSVAPFQMAREA